ncbi:MAG: IS66 family transposase [bacterium]|nr:IS66 family transposase [bacterium]
MQTSHDDSDLDALPAAIKAAFLTERAARIEAEARAGQLEKHNSHLEEYAKRLEYLVVEFKHALYGKKSERLDPDQLALAFEDLETAIGEAESTGDSGGEESFSPDKPKRRAKRNLGHLPKELPRTERVIEPDSIQCSCGCGEMKRIGEDRSERLDIIPAQFRVIVTIRPKYACRSCEGKVIQASAPAHLIEGALPSEGLIAHVLVSKWADHLPLYRQSQIYMRSGLDLHRSTLANWAGKAAFHLRPIFNHMTENLKSSSKLFMDETTAPVLDPGRGKTKTGYLWAIARDDRGWNGSDPPCVLFNYAPGRSGKHAEEFLNGFNGILQVDGYAGYNRLTRNDRNGGDPVMLAYCWAHARRKLHDLAEKSGSQIAIEGLKQIAALYQIEANIRGKSPQQRLAVRQARSAPIVKVFGIWLKQQRVRVSPKSRIGEKLAYIANHWDGLQLFLTDGRVEIDSNAVENTIRPIALNRKNALFAGHDEGGKNWGLFASLIETCKLNGINPFDYLKATLEALASGHPQSRIDELMPWAFKKKST